MSCKHPVAENLDYCPICELDEEHQDGAHQYGCFCDQISGAYLTEHYEVVAENLLADAIRVFHATGQRVAQLERLLRSYDYAPAGDPDRAQTLEQMPYDRYLSSPEWAEQRQRALIRADGRCQTCNDDRFLETHHRTYERRGDEIPDDLTILCSACHTAVHLVIDARKGKVRSKSKRARV